MDSKYEVSQKVWWVEDRPTEFDHRRKWFFRDKKSTDTGLILSQLKEMVDSGEVVGVATVAICADGRYHLIVTGEAFDDPHRALGGTQRLVSAIECLLPDIYKQEE